LVAKSAHGDALQVFSLKQYAGGRMQCLSVQFIAAKGSNIAIEGEIHLQLLQLPAICCWIFFKLIFQLGYQSSSPY
jgi:hypothetical protein